MYVTLAAASVSLALGLFGKAPGAAAALAAKPVQVIALPKVRGRIDHLDVDIAGKRLFVAALGNGSVAVIDLDRGVVAHTIQGLSEPQGVAYVPAQNRLFVACGGDGILRSFDGGDFRPLQTFDLGADADNLRYAAETGLLYAGFGDGGVAVLDVKSGTLSRIALGAHPEAFAYGRADNRLYVNVPDAGEIDVIDCGTKSLFARWPLRGLAANFPMDLDAADSKLLVGFRSPPALAAFEARTGEEKWRTPIDGDVDDVFYDPVSRGIFLACGSGYLDFIPHGGEAGPGTPTRFRTSRGARTALFVPAWRRLYVAVPASGGADAAVEAFAADSLIAASIP